MLPPLELIERLAALIPPPRRHRHRYYEVLAPNAPLRVAGHRAGRLLNLRKAAIRWAGARWLLWVDLSRSSANGADRFAHRPR
jgi:hypothetical protein